MAPPAAAMAAAEDSEDYNSASDSDFNASLSGSSAVESNASDDDTASAPPATAATAGTKGGRRGRGRPPTKSKPKKVTQDEGGDLEMGSGDEGIIAQGRKKLKGKKKKGKKGKGKGEDSAEDDSDKDEEGGVGIRVRLRSGRGGREEVSQKKAIPQTSQATVDIDSIWARMNDPTASPSKPCAPSPKAVPKSPSANKTKPPDAQVSQPASTETISIPHTYTFAGETHTSTKLVPANSPEALAYLASKDKDKDNDRATTATSSTSTGPILRRPLRRKNLLDPNPSHLIKGLPWIPRTDLPISIGGTHTSAINEDKENAVKQSTLTKKPGVVTLNTVEKSKLDWQEEVARHDGMRDELAAAEKSGRNYLGRMDFLDRVGEVRELEERRARQAGK